MGMVTIEVTGSAQVETSMSTVYVATYPPIGPLDTVEFEDTVTKYPAADWQGPL